MPQWRSATAGCTVAFTSIPPTLLGWRWAGWWPRGSNDRVPPAGRQPAAPRWLRRQLARSRPLAGTTTTACCCGGGKLVDSSQQLNLMTGWISHWAHKC